MGSPTRVVAGEVVVPTGRTVDPRPPGWGVVAVCVLSAVLVTVVMAVTVAGAAVLSVPRRVVRRRARYVGAHTEGRVIA